MPLQPGKPLQRRTGLKRGGGLARQGKLARRRLEQDEVERRREVRRRVFERDGRCQLEGYGRCFGHPTPHHRRKEGQGGSYTEENLVQLCAHHNDQLEADAELARIGRQLGLVLKAGDEP